MVTWQPRFGLSLSVPAVLSHGVTDRTEFIYRPIGLPTLYGTDFSESHFGPRLRTERRRRAYSQVKSRGEFSFSTEKDVSCAVLNLILPPSGGGEGE